MPLNENELTIIDGFNKEHGDLLTRYFQAESDRRIAQALKTHDAKSLTVPKAFERLQKIEAAAAEKIRKIELEKNVLKKCIDKNLDYHLVEDLGLTFKDESEIDSKLKILIDAQAKRKIDELNELAIRTSYKPGGGLGGKEYSTDKDRMINEYRSHLPAADRAALEKLGK